MKILESESGGAGVAGRTLSVEIPKIYKFLSANSNSNKLKNLDESADVLLHAAENRMMFTFSIVHTYIVLW